MSEISKRKAGRSSAGRSSAGGNTAAGHDTAVIVFVTSLAVIAVILIASIAVISMLYAQSEQLSDIVVSIMDNIAMDKWDRAANEVRLLKEKWMETEELWAMLLDHFEIDNIGSVMQRMYELVERRQKELALAESSVLLLYVRHIPQKESFSLANIF